MMQLIIHFFSAIKNNFDFIFNKVDFALFSAYTIVFDVLFVSIFFYFLIVWILKSRIWKIFVFIWLFSILYFIAILFKLIAFEEVMRFLFLFSIIIFPIIYQNEFRKWIDSLWIINFRKRMEAKKYHKIIKEVKYAIEILSKKRIWALIVFEKNIDLWNYCSTWIKLNAFLSKELIINIFSPKSPLHDWAIIVKNDIIISAWSVLPLSHNINDVRYWTRHKSAIWISEMTDAVVIVVSEERWDISFVKEWEIFSNITLHELEDSLFNEQI